LRRWYSTVLGVRKSLVALERDALESGRLEGFRRARSPAQDHRCLIHDRAPGGEQDGVQGGLVQPVGVVNHHE
jgi:hypothetical protein